MDSHRPEDDKVFLTGEPVFFTGAEFTVSLEPVAHAEMARQRERFEALAADIGCPECGLIPLGGPVLCEHGVAPAPTFERSFTVEIEDPDLFRRLTGLGPGEAA
jgi:hypothetical protein